MASKHRFHLAGVVPPRTQTHLWDREPLSEALRVTTLVRAPCCSCCEPCDCVPPSWRVPCAALDSLAHAPMPSPVHSFFFYIYLSHSCACLQDQDVSVELDASAVAALQVATHARAAAPMLALRSRCNAGTGAVTATLSADSPDGGLGGVERVVAVQSEPAIADGDVRRCPCSVAPAKLGKHFANHPEFPTI